MDSFIEDLLVACSTDTKLLAKTFMPDRFSSPFSTVLHDPIFDLIDSGERYIAIAAPRGTGKTSLSLAKAAQSILFRKRRFIPWVSTSHDIATLQTENLKRELVTAPEIKKIFGGVKTRQAGELDESFSKKAWVGYNHSLVLPRGCGQQVRGILFGSARPDLIIVDDLEDADDVKNDDLRRALKQWFWADLIKCTSRFDKDFQIIYIDTLKHEDALLQDLLDSPSWASVRLEICNDDLISADPVFMPQQEVTALYDSHAEQGQLDVFYREFRNLPIAKANASFQQRYFQYMTVPESLECGAKWEYVVLVDPAKTVNMNSCESAVVGVGIDTHGNRLYVRDVVAGKFHPDELYDHAISMCVRLGARVLAVEETSLKEFISQPIKNELTRRELHTIEYLGLEARGGVRAESKEQRIRALVPYYRQGLVFHNPAVCAALEAQLMAFPRSKRWDIMDALAYIIALLDVGGRFFEAPSTEDEDDNYYNELENDNDMPELSNWRCA